MEFIVDNANQSHTPSSKTNLDGYWYDPGLLKTSVCESSITWLDGSKGELRYRGYAIDQLANEHSFQDVMYLLLKGELPNENESRSFKDLVKKSYKLPEEFEKTLALLPQKSHPMATLMALLASISCHCEHDASQLKNQNHREQAAMHLLAIMPTLAIASLKKYLNSDFHPCQETAVSSHSITEEMMGLTLANDHIYVQAIDKILTLHADHELNASTFTMRVTASTNSNPYACLQAAIAALWGPAHGGANEACLNMLTEISRTNDIDKYIAKVKDKNDPFKLMGFGHRVYKNYDPRAKIMRKICHEVIANTGQKSQLLDTAMQLEQIALSDPYFIERKLYPNIDFYSGITLKALNIPSQMYTVIFALARTIGWLSHWLEMHNNGPFKIFRPRQVYVGITERELA